MFLSEGSVFGDIFAAALSLAACSYVCLALGRIQKNGLLELQLYRKLLHAIVGLILMICWPLFSSGHRGAIFAALIPGLFLIKAVSEVLGIIPLGSYQGKNQQQPRDQLKAALGYLLTLIFATSYYWRKPVAIAIICNLCAGDGMADIAGRRFGSWKLPYNKNKSYAGSIGMFIAGLLASIGYMYYFSWFGYIQGSVDMVRGFIIVSFVSTLVESHPFSTKVDDNLTVPFAAMLVGSFIF